MKGNAKRYVDIQFSTEETETVNHSRRFLGRRIGPSNQKGQSLIEYVIYIGLAALVLGGIIYFATSGRRNTAVQNEASTLTSIVGATQKLYNSDPNGFANVTATALINNGVIPSSDVVNGAMVSGFGTPITVAPATLYNANDGVAFTYGVPPDDCSGFVQAVASDFAQITIGGQLVKDVTSNTALSAATLGTRCTSTGGGNVPIILTATR